MPILDLEPNCYPENLFADGVVSTDNEAAWWVLHTKPRQEKALGRQLFRLGVPFYLPLIVRRTRVRGKILSSHVPLFGGYLFLFARPEERIAALSTNRVVKSLHVGAQEGLWRDLSQVHRLISTGAPITPEDRLEAGDEVDITSGPLAGLKGTILRGTSGRRFVVKVNFIQQGASVVLDDYMLTPVV